MKLGERVLVSTEPTVPESTSTVYVVAGICEGRSIWLTVEEDEYDGYDGDLILQPIGHDLAPHTYRIVLQDERSNFHGELHLWSA